MKTQAAYDEALARLEAHMEKHRFSGSTTIIKDALNNKPVKLSDMFFALDEKHRNDVFAVMSMARIYGFPEIA